MATPRVPPERPRRAVRGSAARAVKAGRAARAEAAAAASAATPGEAPPRVALEGVRTRIDTVDEQIHRLLNERARLAQQVGISKAHDGRTVDFYRPEREAQVLRLARSRNAGPLRDEEVLRLFREIMSACLAQQEPLKVAFLGPEGTFTQSAVLNHFGHSVRALVQQPVDLLIDRIDAGAHVLERRPPRRLAGARGALAPGAALPGGRIPRTGHALQRRRADSTPSMARISSSSPAPSAPSASMSV